MKIALVHPFQSSGEEKSVPPLGLLHLASFVRAHLSEVQVAIFDARPNRLSAERVAAEVIEFAPDIVGVYGITNQRSSAHAVISCVRPHVKWVVLGGPYASSCHARLVADPDIDFIVAGEGEIPFLKLIERLSAGGDCSGIPRVMPGRRVSGEIPEVARTWSFSDDLVKDLETLPDPAIDLITVSDYFKVQSSQSSLQWTNKSWPLMTSRGCPYACAFCHNHFSTRFRGRDVVKVVDQMEKMHREHGVLHFEILDDCFNFERGRVEKFCGELARRRLPIRFSFPNGLRCDRLTFDEIDALVGAGLWTMSIAIESASQRIQDLMKKHMNLARAREIIHYAHKKNVFVTGFFIVGYPTETREEALATLDFALKSGLRGAIFHRACAYPGTSMYEDLSSEQKEQMWIWLNGSEVLNYSYAPNFSRMSDRELRNIFLRMFLSFYMRPMVIFSILRRFSFRAIYRGVLIFIYRGVLALTKVRRLIFNS